MSDVNVNAQVQNESEALKNSVGILTFYIEEQVYGVEIQYVTDIIEIQPVTIIPKMPDYIKGVINLRGKVIPVMNVRSRFGKELIEYDERTCIIVIEWEDTSVGLIIDRVCEVINVPAESITLPPDYKSVNSNKFIKNIVKVDDQVKLLLDCQKLIVD